MPTAKKLTTSATVMNRTRIVPTDFPPRLLFPDGTTAPRQPHKVFFVSSCPCGLFGRGWACPFVLRLGARAGGAGGKGDGKSEGGGAGRVGAGERDARARVGP